VITAKGDHLKLRLEDVESGTYRFIVTDDDGLNSEVTSVNLVVRGHIPWEIVGLTTGVLAIAIGRIIQRKMHDKRRFGKIRAISKPDAWVFVDGTLYGRSSMTSRFTEGLHEVRFWEELGYVECTKAAKVIPGETTEVRCKLYEIPKVKLKVSAKSKRPMESIDP